MLCVDYSLGAGLVYITHEVWFVSHSPAVSRHTKKCKDQRDPHFRKVTSSSSLKQMDLVALIVRAAHEEARHPAK